MTNKLAPPAEIKQIPKARFWGDRKPPKNRAEMFSVVRDAAAGGTGTAAAVSGVATLRIYGPIDSYGGWWGISAQDVSSALDSLGEDITELRVRINSPGGEVWEGMAILNMLRAHPARVVAVVDGIAASAASVIATGCDETVMSPGTQLMVHDASGFCLGQAKDMRKMGEALDSISDSIAAIYAESAGGTAGEWRAVMVEETWYTATEAVDAKLADRVAVVADAGETSTAGDDPAIPGDVEDSFDLSIFNHAGRSHAPAPKPPSASPRSGHHKTEGGPAVAFSDEQFTTMRAKLGLPETADEAAVVAAVNSVVDESLEEHADPAGFTPPEGMALIDTAVLDELRAGASDGREARQQQREQARDNAIQAAISSGRVPKARREHYQLAWDADPEGTRQILDALEPGLVPLSELGHDNPVDETQSEYDAVFSADDAELAAFASQFGLTKEALRG